ncbi:hypothetical protein ES702_03122 [subsurface metagenome]
MWRRNDLFEPSDTMEESLFCQVLITNVSTVHLCYVWHHPTPSLESYLLSSIYEE